MDIYKIKRLVYLSPIGKSRLINLYRFPVNIQIKLDLIILV